MQKTLNPVYNKNLFSNYYLENRVKVSDELKKDEHIEAFSNIKQKYDEEKASFGNNEAQLRKHFLDAVFDVLLYETEVEEATQGQFPDYGFFKDKQSRDEAHKNKGNFSFYKNALAIGEAKAWDVELDGKPSKQLWNYLNYTGVKWGILTNGKKWRLYCKEKKTLDDFYEVNLEEILENNDIERFKCFFYFFRRDALLPLPEIFLDTLLKGSEDHVTAIGKSLKDNMYKAMKIIADGFFNRPQNDLDKGDDGLRALVQKNTMYFLYRLLFLLYAEDNSLLDLKNTKYLNNHSFYRIKKDVNERRGSNEQGYDFSSTSIWDRLKNLFELIDLGSEALGEKEFHIPAYNGGLFDKEKHPELDRKWKIGDYYLAEAIHLLTWSNVNGSGFVDYADLEIQHLGSIYEGLLEYRLKIADADIVEKGNEWITLEKFNENKKQTKSFGDFDEFSRAKAGELYLATDKGDRKATGSYYTPDYIVNYIVENTVGAVVEEKWKEAESKNQTFLDATLSVKVLDPAMGSGHFLVGAVDFLADKLMDAAQKDVEAERLEDAAYFYDTGWARREVVSHCIYGVDLNPMAVELAKVGLWLKTISKDKPLSFLDHRLKQGNSLVGARLSDAQFYPDLKKKIDRGTTKQTILGKMFIERLLDKITELEKISDDKLEDIKKKEKIFNEFKDLDEYKKSKAFADVYTALFFGNEISSDPVKSKKLYYYLIYALDYPSNWEKTIYQPWFKKAMEIAGDKSFFHWELEFPEIFFEGGAAKENPGWDAVVGNPPYIRIQARDESNKGFITRMYETAIGNYDIYVPFVEKSMSMLNKYGHFCFIMPNKFINVDYGGKLREFTEKNKLLECLLNFGDNQIFSPQTTYTCLFFLSKTHENFTYYEVQTLRETNKELPMVLLTINNSPSVYQLDVITQELNSKSWHFFVGPIGNILSRMDKMPLKLDDIIERDFQGVATSDDQVYILEIRDESSHLLKVFSKSLGKEIEIEKDSVKPLFKGSEIAKYHIAMYRFCLLHPYSIGKNGHYLIPPEEYEHRWPKAWNYLKENEQRLRQRERGKMDQKEWYAYVYPKNLDQFERPKIMTQVLSKEPVFSFDSEGKYFFVGGGTAGGHGMTLKDSYGLTPKYILCLLNSRLLDAFFDKISTRFRGGYRAYTKGFTGKLPIRHINFTTPPDRRAALLEEAKALYSEFSGAPKGNESDGINRMDRINASTNPVNPVHPVQNGDSSGTAPDGNKVLEFVSARLDAEPEESDVVHDLLAYLAERMIEMNKEKNSEIKGFLGWFEGEIGAPVEELTNKTALREYYNHDFQNPDKKTPSLIGILEKNKKKLGDGYDPKSPANYKHLQQWYDDSKGRIAPLLEKINATDGLIDAIVYKLYGLTDDEIKIVKESVGGKQA